MRGPPGGRRGHRPRRTPAKDRALRAQSTGRGQAAGSSLASYRAASSCFVFFRAPLGASRLHGARLPHGGEGARRGQSFDRRRSVGRGANSRQADRSSAWSGTEPCEVRRAGGGATGLAAHRRRTEPSGHSRSGAGKPPVAQVLAAARRARALCSSGRPSGRRGFTGPTGGRGLGVGKASTDGGPWAGVLIRVKRIGPRLAAVPNHARSAGRAAGPQASPHTGEGQSPMGTVGRARASRR